MAETSNRQARCIPSALVGYHGPMSALQKLSDLFRISVVALWGIYGSFECPLQEVSPRGCFRTRILPPLGELISPTSPPTWRVASGLTTSETTESEASFEDPTPKHKIYARSRSGFYMRRSSLRIRRWNSLGSYKYPEKAFRYLLIGSRPS